MFEVSERDVYMNAFLIHSLPFRKLRHVGKSDKHGLLVIIQ